MPLPDKRMPRWLGYQYIRLKEYYAYLGKKRVEMPLEFADMIRYSQYYDCGKAKRELYNISTPLDITLDKAYEWFKKYKYIA